MNPKEALGLPPGSVRALLAIMLEAGLLAAVFVGVAEGHLAVLSGLAGMVVQAYFQRQKTPGG